LVRSDFKRSHSISPKRGAGTRQRRKHADLRQLAGLLLASFDSWSGTDKNEKRRGNNDSEYGPNFHKRASMPASARLSR
jgi:hypothetical protein